MKRRTLTHTRWLRRIALGLAVVAVAAPSAQGMILEDTTGNSGSGQVTDGLGRPLDPSAVKGPEQTPTVVVDISKFRIATQIADEPVRPDDRAVRPAPADVLTQTPVRPDDRAIRPTIVDGTQAPVVLTPVGRVHGPVPGDTALISDQPQSAPVSGTSFDWNDAGIGIAIGVAACLALMTAWMLLGGRKPDHFAGA